MFENFKKKKYMKKINKNIELLDSSFPGEYTLKKYKDKYIIQQFGATITPQMNIEECLNMVRLTVLNTRASRQVF